MQLSEDTRFSVTRRIEGVGKEIMLSWTEGGGVLNCGLDIVAARRVGVWKTRTGMGMRARM
jgi:hypothetical protein